jgi:hypothetical protein
MPALTHGRVKNGFNLFPRTIKYAQPSCNKEQTPQQKAAQEEREKQGYKKLAEYDQNGNRVCENAQRGLCCGSAIQPRNLGPGHLFQRYRVPTKPCNRKHASNVVTGRSFAAKRAIARRSANCNTSPRRPGTVTFIVYAQPEDLYSIGTNPYLLDFASLSSSGPPPIGSSCNFIKIRDYTIKQKTQAQGGAPRYYDITANYDLIYNTIVINNSGTNFKIQKSDNIISKPVFWTLLPKSSITINQSNIIANVSASVSGNNDTEDSFNITLPTNASTNCCCLLPTVTYSGPRNAYRMPCSGGPAKRTLLQPCTNPTYSQLQIN